MNFFCIATFSRSFGRFGHFRISFGTVGGFFLLITIRIVSINSKSRGDPKPDDLVYFKFESGCYCYRSTHVVHVLQRIWLEFLRQIILAQFPKQKHLAKNYGLAYTAPALLLLSEIQKLLSKDTPHRNYIRFAGKPLVLFGSSDVWTVHGNRIENRSHETFIHDSERKRVNWLKSWNKKNTLSTRVDYFDQSPYFNMFLTEFCVPLT